MGKSIQQIRDENKCFYMDTYASRITRNYFLGMIIFLACWSLELLFMKWSFDKLYYYKFARSENLANQEVKEWIEEQIWKNCISWGNFIIVAMIISMGFLFFHFWKMKRYELHKSWKKMFYLPLLIVILGNVLVFLLLLRRGEPYIGRNILAMLINVLPYLTLTKILFPLEIKRNEKRDWKVLEWMGKLIDLFDVGGKIIKKL